MARNAIESEFWKSKMGAGGHFVKIKIKQFRIDLKWPVIGRWQSFCKNKKFHTNKNCGIDLKW